MPSGCCAPRCTNSNKDGYCLATLGQDPQLKQKWIDAAGEPDWHPSKSARLCEVHFHPSAVYCVGKRKFIKKSAIPSFFCKCNIFHNQDAISDCSLRPGYCKKYPLKLKRRQFIHNENCCVKQSPLDIKMVNQSTKAIRAKEEKEELEHLQIDAYYKTMQVKLSNIMQENKILNERVHHLQDDLEHIKSFGFDLTDEC